MHAMAAVERLVVRQRFIPLVERNPPRIVAHARGEKLAAGVAQATPKPQATGQDSKLICFSKDYFNW